MVQFLLTRLLRGVTFTTQAHGRQFVISTHTPLARRDKQQANWRLRAFYFYSHASCEAWQSVWNKEIICIHFYSHASCEAWRLHFGTTLNQSIFLLTRLLRGVTTYAPWWPWSLQFLLTRLLRGVTAAAIIQSRKAWFLLTRLLRGVTFRFHTCNEIFEFLLTRLLRGVTLYRIDTARKAKFLLTRLLRGVTCKACSFIFSTKISTHTPLARRDGYYTDWTTERIISTHTPLARRDLFLFS